jgi:hypothetical protein
MRALTPDNASEMTKGLWTQLKNLPEDTYNCNFATECFIKAGKLAGELSSRANLDKLAHNDSNPIVRTMASLTERAMDGMRDSTAGINQVLKECGYKELGDKQNGKYSDLKSGGYAAGDIITLYTNKDVAHGVERSQHSAIITKVDASGHIQTIEQKPNGSDPPIVTNVNEFMQLEMKQNNRTLSATEAHVQVHRKQG